jgi:hypothetical protein
MLLFPKVSTGGFSCTNNVFVHAPSAVRATGVSALNMPPATQLDATNPVIGCTQPVNGNMSIAQAPSHGDVEVPCEFAVDEPTVNYELALPTAPLHTLDDIRDES